MDGQAWWAAVHGVAELNTTERLSTHVHTHTQTLHPEIRSQILLRLLTRRLASIDKKSVSF